MLPGDSPLLIDQEVLSVFQWPMRRSDKLLLDYEMGSLALNDPSGGLDQFNWQLSYSDPAVQLTGPAGQTTLLTIPGVTELALAFDFNMQPFVAYVDTVGAHYWRYNSASDVHETADLPPDATHPRCCLDLRDQALLSAADIILAYQRGTALCYRQQRDSYATEYQLTDDCGGNLISVGLTTQNRLCFRIIP